MLGYTETELVGESIWKFTHLEDVEESKRDDLDRLSQDGSTSLEEMDALQELDRQAWQRGERVLFVPTFYAWGRKE